MTAPRQAIFQALHTMDGHLTADEIFTRLRLQFPGIGLATVYRNLELLRSNGHVLALDSGDGKLRYELKEKQGTTAHHHHLICRQCGEVVNYMDFEQEELNLVQKIQAHLMRKYKYQIADHDITFYGGCPNCLKRSA
ncbi:transcriptional repressor [candidate division TA06 bacterium]|uniref:Transcriptional repressor n=1 Tax=candidate division TA06 bacterium TaxID=2250710 RepID=A0A933I8E0_UNCT6|nr:transcriptional repressor [candidate division TA06 bacterium]